ncbi:MAG: Beta-galactosidase C-terminal domain [Verrucomicrobiia bacterium]
MCNQGFYFDLIAWLRQLCNLFPILKVPETIEVSLRQNDKIKLYFLLNHQNSPVRITFFKPVHNFLTGQTISGNYDLQPYDVLVVDQRAES